MTEVVNEVQLQCAFQFSVFPAGYRGAGKRERKWCVIKYQDERTGKNFTAKGYNLPARKGLSFLLSGSWEESPKYGRSFQVYTYEICRPTDKASGAIYLRELKVGLTKKQAEQICRRFGDGLWDILEHEPTRLSELPTLGTELVERIARRYRDLQMDKELVSLFSGVCILTPQKLQALKSLGGPDVVSLLREDPYRVCELDGFSFAIADSLAKKLLIWPTALCRLDAGVQEVFRQEAGNGHVCVPKNTFLHSFLWLINHSWGGREILQEDEAKNFLNGAWKRREVHISSGYFYSAKRYVQETGIAANLVRRQVTRTLDCCEAGHALAEYEGSIGLSLVKEQREAVLSVFRYPVSIITGGPGTGKSTVIDAILAVHEVLAGEKAKPLLLAPTGRAARRMSEVTGKAATTLHAGLGLKPGDTPDADAPPLEADLLIVDEFSMCDLDLMDFLLRRVSYSTRLVLIGDPFQLPSVGCGAVLSELIRSRVIPSTTLQAVFRQQESSPIVTNAARICAGSTDLLIGSEFQVLYEAGTEEVFQRVCMVYRECVSEQGRENVILLCPYREKSPLSVKRLNAALQEALNPIEEGALFVEKGRGIRFHARDPVMQQRNTDVVCNGDVGVVESVENVPVPEDPTRWMTQAVVRFEGYEEEFRYPAYGIGDLDLAYCSTVHKAQGSQYDTVILALSEHHKALLRRNLLYTAITRAKKKVIIITEASASGQTALVRSIRDTISETRHTLLADRIRMEAEKIVAEE